MDSLYEELSEHPYVFASFEKDYLKEDENSPEYHHKLTGEKSIHNYYVNYFTLSSSEIYGGVEIGITNDYSSVNIYINNILVYK